MALFPMAIIVVFFQDDVGLTMTEVFLLQGFFGVTVALCELPSGYLADRIGYRRTLIAASLLSIAGWSVYAMAGGLPAIVLAEALMGVSLALASGADLALLYESLLATGREEYYARWNGLYRFWAQSAEGSAALVAGVLYAMWHRAPFVAQIAVWGVAVLLCLRLHEPPRQEVARDHHGRALWAVVRRALWEDAHLRAVILLTIVLGLSSFVPVWLIAVYARDAGLPVEWLGVLWAVANYSVAGGALLSAPLQQRLGTFPALALCLALAVLSYLGLGLSFGLFGFLFYYCTTVQRGLNGPVLNHLEQRLIPSADRATFLSLRSLVFRLSFLGLAPLIGATVDAYGQHPVLLILAIVFAGAGSAAWLELRGRERAAADEAG